MKPSLAFIKQHVVPTLVCFGVALALMQTASLQRVENVTFDDRVRLRESLEMALPADELVLLGIDETSLRELGRWPWNRELHGDLLQLMSRVRPSVVAWDILFTEPTDADTYFAQCIVRNRAVVFGAMQAPDTEDGVTVADAAAAGVQLQPLTRIEGDPRTILSSSTLLPPTPQLGAVSAIGFVDTPPDVDGVRRTIPLVVRVGDQVFPTLSLRTLMAYWGAGPENVTVRLGDAVIIDAPLGYRRVPIDAAGAYAINYRYTQDGFVRASYSRVLNSLKQRYVDRRPVPLSALAGRIVLVGQVAEGLSDFGATPFSPLTPLVLVHANAIDNVLREDYVRRVSPWPVWLGAMAVGIVGLARFSPRPPAAQAAFAIGVPVAYAFVAVMVWISGSWLLPIVGPLLGFIALQVFMIGRRMLTELRAKEQIKDMFRTYVSPELVSRLIASGRPPELGGHTEEITAYFSDIQDFSAFSEVLPPDRLVVLMNEYLTACTDILQAEGGTLDKYIGDAVVAMFGAPVPLPDHAYRACVTVVRVQHAMEELRVRWRTDGGWPEMVGRMRCRIGLNTGLSTIGNVGSRTRFNYTMMGDNVNLAARMESGAKSWGTYAMCTDATRRACERHDGGRVVFRALGRIRVKGRAACVPIHEIAGLRDSYPEGGRECIGVFEQALERYYARDWNGAEKLFRRSAELEPLIPGQSPGVRANPSRVYISLVEHCRLEPPPPDWDGVTIMTEK